MLPARSAGPFATAFACIVAAAEARAGDQPQWGQRGTRNMVSDETGLPETFDPAAGANVRWSAALGTHAYASPIIAGGRVLAGTNNEQPRDGRHRGDRGILMCFDEKDGRFLWQLVVPKREDDRFADWPATGIASTPAVEGDRVYLVTNRGEVACLDLDGLADGNDGPFLDEGRHLTPRTAIQTLGPIEEVGPTDADIIWLYDLGKELGVHQHDAAHCSVLLDRDFLYVCTSNGVDAAHKRVVAPEAPSLVVLEKSSGRLVARDEERIGPRVIHSTWSSPSVGEVNGRALVFFGGGDGICYAFEALSAPPPSAPVRLKKVWWFDCDPTAPKEEVHRFQDNLKEGPSNITGMPVFHRGRVYVTAGGDLWHGKLKAWLKCIDATKTGDVTREGEMWSYPLERHCMSTPAVRDGLVYIADCGRKVHCVDADTGRAHWVHDAQGEIWSSTLVADGKVFVGTQKNRFWILAAGKELKVLGSVRLDSAIPASPTAANGVLYVATMNRLFALAKPLSK